MALTIAVLIALLLPPRAAAHSLVFVSPSKVSLSPSTKNKTAQAKVTIKNEGGTTSLKFKVVPANNVTVKKQSVEMIDAFSVREVTVTLKPRDPQKDFKGTLVVGGSPKTVAGTVALEIKPKAKPPNWLYLVIFGPLVGAAGLIFVRWIFLYDPPKYRLRKRLGPANWDFSKSWASNITVVGALLGTVLAAGVLPEETTTVSKATYSGLNLFFGVLVLIAPLIYIASERAKRVHRSTTVKEAQYQGYVWSFLLASTITLWAAAGELVTVALLFQEIKTTGSLPDAAICIMWAAVALAMALFGVYTWRTIRAIVVYQTDPQRLRRRKREQFMVLRSRVGTAGLPAPIPSEADIDPELPTIAPL